MNKLTGRTKLLLEAGSIILVLAVGGTMGFNWYQQLASHEETDDAAVSGHLHIISPRVAGTVAEILVKENQFVNKGDLLVKLDPTDFQIQVQQANAAVEIAEKQANAAAASVPQMDQTAVAQATKAKGSITEKESAVSAAEAQVAEARSAIPAAEAKIAETEAVLHKSKADYERYLTLEKQGAISKQQLDDAKASFLVAESSRKQAVEGLTQAHARLKMAEHSVAKAEAELVSAQSELQNATAMQLQTQVTRKQSEAQLSTIAQASANLRNAHQQLSYTEIRAPISGIVGRKSVEIGQRLQTGQQILAIVPQEHWVVANFKETQLERMHPGQRVEIKIDSFPHHKFTGKVESISPASGAQFALLPPENATGNFTKIVQRVPVKILFDTKSVTGFEPRIAAGMSATVRVDVE